MRKKFFNGFTAKTTVPSCTKYTFLAVPTIDGTRNDAQPHVIVGRGITLRCTTGGHPMPTVKWLKNGNELTPGDSSGLRFVDDNQGLEIIDAQQAHAARWTCVVSNDAGNAELDINLDVWGTLIAYPDSWTPGSCLWISSVALS